jgi:hypothetical protein
VHRVSGSSGPRRGQTAALFIGASALPSHQFVVGAPGTLAEEIIAQCRRTGAGNFAALFDRTLPPEALRGWYRQFGEVAIPVLRRAHV